MKFRCTGRFSRRQRKSIVRFIESKVPLNTLSADIDYGFAEALTTYGIIGIKTWIFKGEVFDLESKNSQESADKKRTNS